MHQHATDQDKSDLVKTLCTNTQIFPLVLRKSLTGKAAQCPSMRIDSKEDYTLSYQLPGR